MTAAAIAGAVRYRAETDLAQVLSCNCSHCQKRGLMLTFVTPDHFTLLSGGDGLADYQFNKKVIHHLFCHDLRHRILRPRPASRTAPRWSRSMSAAWTAST